jgi:glyceraldehyde 3-phosphate dehydrogenase
VGNGVARNTAPAGRERTASLLGTLPVICRSLWSPVTIFLRFAAGHFFQVFTILVGGDMAIKVGINGFGRIGRNVLRASLDDPNLEFVAVNDLTDPKTLAHLLKYDSILGNLHNKISSGSDCISVDGRGIKVFAEKDPAKLSWESVGAQVVLESTGRFTDANDAKKHLRGPVRKVIISAPAKNEDVTIVLGVNQQVYDAAKHHIISNASCTTNCLAPIAKVVHDSFKIVSGTMTTIHSYTNDQVILDFPHKDLRRARAAAVSMIPTSTGAAKALHLVIPELKGKLDGFAMRVPTPNVSVVDLVAFVEKKTTAEEVNAAMKKATETGPLKGYLGYEENELVSMDFRGDARSSIVDAPMTRVVAGNCVKVISWYDNEWGYSCRVRDLINYIASKGL